VQVHARGVIWSVDGTELGRDGWGTAVVAEQVRDVGAGKTLGVSVGPPPTSEEVVVLMQRVVETTGEAPLVLAADGGPENRGELIAWCREHGVILLRSLPYTPQHNPWVEHGNGELKRETGLASNSIVLDVRELPTLLLKALDRIDGTIPRATRGWRTAREAWREMPCAERLVDRADLRAEVACAIREAVRGCCSWRERRLAKRRAILAVLERHGLVTSTRGRSRRDGGQPDRVL
jgi:hypothetical protein